MCSRIQYAPTPNPGPSPNPTLILTLNLTLIVALGLALTRTLSLTLALPLPLPAMTRYKTAELKDWSDFHPIESLTLPYPTPALPLTHP